MLLVFGIATLESDLTPFISKTQGLTSHPPSRFYTPGLPITSQNPYAIGKHVV